MDAVRKTGRSWRAGGWRYAVVHAAPISALVLALFYYWWAGEIHDRGQHGRHGQHG